MIIHRYWAGPTQPSHDFTSRLQYLNSEAMLWDWSPETISPDWFEMARSTERLVVERDVHRHYANIVRLCALQEYGGVWVDWDLEPIVPFNTLPTRATAAHRGGNRCNCWMAFEQGDSALAELLCAIQEQPNRVVGRSTEISGERWLDNLPDDVEKLLLYRDSDGEVNIGATRWAEHKNASLLV